jgi:hypothetical protein
VLLKLQYNCGWCHIWLWFSTISRIAKALVAYFRNLWNIKLWNQIVRSLQCKFSYDKHLLSKNFTKLFTHTL